MSCDPQLGTKDIRLRAVLFHVLVTTPPPPPPLPWPSSPTLWSWVPWGTWFRGQGRRGEFTDGLQDNTTTNISSATLITVIMLIVDDRGLCCVCAASAGLSVYSSRLSDVNMMTVPISQTGTLRVGAVTSLPTARGCELHSSSALPDLSACAPHVLLPQTRVSCQQVPEPPAHGDHGASSRIPGSSPPAPTESPAFLSSAPRARAQAQAALVTGAKPPWTVPGQDLSPSASARSESRAGKQLRHESWGNKVQQAHCQEVRARLQLRGGGP